MKQNIKSKEEAKKFILNNPKLSSMLENMAFRQVVLNILIASGIATENDLNAALKTFEDQLLDEIADKMLKVQETLDQELSKLFENMPDDYDIFEDQDDDFFEYDDDNDDRIGKA